MTTINVDLLSFLRQNQSIKSTTFESLVDFGFDSSDSLLALDYNKDLSQLSTISLGQRSLLRRLLNEFKCIYINNNENNSNANNDSNCERKVCKSDHLLNKIKGLIGFHNNSNEEKLSQTNKKLKQLLVQNRYLIEKYEKESKDKDSQIKRLEKEVFRQKKVMSSLKKEFNNNWTKSQKSLKNVKTFLLESCERLNDKHSEHVEYCDTSEASDRTPPHSPQTLCITKVSELTQELVKPQEIIVEPIIQGMTRFDNSVPNITTEEVSQSIAPIVEYMNSNQIDCNINRIKTEVIHNGFNTMSDNKNNMINAYDCITLNNVSRESNKRSTEAPDDCLDEMNNNKKLKTTNESNTSTHILMIELDSKDEDSEYMSDNNRNEGPVANKVIISTITGSRLSIDINEETAAEDSDNKQSDLMLTQNVETYDTVSHISTSNGYLSDSNEENKCLVNTSKGFKCQLPNCDFATLFKPKFDDHIKNHVSYHLGQEIPEFWKPFFNDFMNKNVKTN